MGWSWDTKTVTRLLGSGRIIQWDVSPHPTPHHTTPSRKVIFTEFTDKIKPAQDKIEKEKNLEEKEENDTHNHEANYQRASWNKASHGDDSLNPNHDSTEVTVRSLKYTIIYPIEHRYVRTGTDVSDLFAGCQNNKTGYSWEKFHGDMRWYSMQMASIFKQHGTCCKCGQETSPRLDPFFVYTISPGVI